jgi:hypothetical protein
VLQVPWKVQLLVTSIEEASKYTALAVAALCRKEGSALAPRLPSWQQACTSLLSVVVTAVAVSCAVEAVYVLFFGGFARWASSARKPAHGLSGHSYRTAGVQDTEGC